MSEMKSRALSASLAPALGALLVAGALLAGAPAARAEQMPEVTVDFDRADSFQRIVHFDDLDIRTDGGMQQLTSRIRAAATDGCRTLYRDMLPGEAIRYGNVCVRTSVGDAKTRLDQAVQVAAATGRPLTQVAVLQVR